MGWLTGVSAVLFFAACVSRDPTSVGNYMMSFTWTPSGSPVLDEVVAEPEFRRVLFNGSMQAAISCVDLSPKVLADGKDITLTVEAKARAGTCTDMPGYFTFRAITGNFRPATYRVKVIYKDESGARTMMAGQVVVVP